MASFNTINLIRTKTTSSPQLEAIERSLRQTGIIGLILFLSTSLIIGIIYGLVSMRYGTLQEEKKTVLTELNTYMQSEIYYRSIKARTSIVEKTLGSQKPWATLLDRIYAFVQPPVLTNISVDEQNKITFNIISDSLESILDIVNAIIVQTKENTISKPKLVSIQIAEDSKIHVSFTFIAIF
jgi:hypothetical protein